MAMISRYIDFLDTKRCNARYDFLTLFNENKTNTNTQRHNRFSGKSILQNLH